MTTPAPTQTVANAAAWAVHAGVDPTTLTARQTAAIDVHIAAVVAALESRLHARVWRRSFVETVELTGERVRLREHPVFEVTALVIDGVNQNLVTPISSTTWRVQSEWLYGREATVTYTAGHDGPNDPLIRGAVLDKIGPFAQSLIAESVGADGSGLTVPTPPAGVKAFTVEGLNVTYESKTERGAAAVKAAADLAASAVWKTEELDALGLTRLKRRVIR